MSPTFPRQFITSKMLITSQVNHPPRMSTSLHLLQEECMMAHQGFSQSFQQLKVTELKSTLKTLYYRHFPHSNADLRTGMHWNATITCLAALLPELLSMVLLSFTQPSILTAQWKTLKLLFSGTGCDTM